MIENRLVSGPEAADLFGIPVAWIHTWRYRRKLMPHGAVRGPGCTGTVPLYRLADVAALVAERHARAQ